MSYHRTDSGHLAAVGLKMAVAAKPAGINELNTQADWDAYESGERTRL
jgi:hypothetical protein